LQNKFRVSFNTGVVSNGWLDRQSKANPTVGQTVSGVDTKAKTVSYGDKKVPYEHLVLATGGVPRRLPIPGFDSKNVYTLRHVQDAQKIDDGRTHRPKFDIMCLQQIPISFEARSRI